tara:strand:- start:13319 stop:13837 length:519 start_codon:yes stop_codon:yes gene_type:complete
MGNGKKSRKHLFTNIKGLIHKHHKLHPALGKDLSFGQKAADSLSEWAGSWTFILALVFALVLWIIVNVTAYVKHWDPYPFILLNFVLSMLAAFQAPIILMSGNRQTERDRINAKYDYAVNRKAEREISDMQKDLEQIKVMIKETHHEVMPNYPGVLARKKKNGKKGKKKVKK